MKARVCVLFLLHTLSIFHSFFRDFKGGIFMNEINIGFVKMAETTNDMNFLRFVGIESYNQTSLEIAKIITQRKDLPSEFIEEAKFHINEMNKMEYATDIHTDVNELVDIAKECHGGTRVAALFTLAQKDVDKFSNGLSSIHLSNCELKDLDDKLRLESYVLYYEDNVIQARAIVDSLIDSLDHEKNSDKTDFSKEESR